MRWTAQFVVLGCLLAASGSLLSAHEPGLSTTTCEIDDATIRLTIGVSPVDWRQLAAGADEAEWLRVGPSLWSLAGDHGTLEVREKTVTHDAENGPVLHLAFDRPPGSRLRLRFAAFDRLPAGHRDYFSSMDSDGAVQTAQLLDAQHPEIILDLPASAPVAKSWWSATSGRAGQSRRTGPTNRQWIVGALASAAGLIWLIGRSALMKRARRSRSTPPSD